MAVTRGVGRRTPTKAASSRVGGRPIFFEAGLFGVIPLNVSSGEDLGAILVRAGFAWAFTRFSVDYVDQQEEARIANRGVHAHDCVGVAGAAASERWTVSCVVRSVVALASYLVAYAAASQSLHIEQR